MSRIVIHKVMQWVENLATLVYKKVKLCISWQNLNNIFLWKEKKKSERNPFLVAIMYHELSDNLSVKLIWITLEPEKTLILKIFEWSS